MSTLPGTPLKVSLAFMEFGRIELMDEYDHVKSGMMSAAGLVFYASPTKSFTAMDLIKQAITDAVTAKDKVTEHARIKDLKNDMRDNATFVESKCNNDLATLLLSNYKEALQGGGPKIVIGAVTNLKVGDTGIVGEMKGTYKKPKGAKYIEGWTSVGGAPFVMTEVSDLKEIVWEGIAKNVDTAFKVRAGAGRRKGPFTPPITGSCRY